MPFNNVFGGAPVQPSNVAYEAIALNANLALNWPTSFLDTTSVVARIMNVNAGVGPFTITMPTAIEVSVGADFMIMNVGANNFTVLDNAGGVLQVCVPGIAYYFWLTDTTTAAGIWSIVTFGAGANIVNANALAGNGLTVIGLTLNTDFPSRNVAVNANATINDRSYLLVWTGGAGTITLPPVAVATQGFYLAVNNEGTGAVVVNTPDGSTIDNAVSQSLNPGSSSYFICTVNGWNKLGYNPGTTQAVTVLPPLNIAGAPVTNLTAQQASRNIMQFTGNLVANATVVYPAVPGIWEVYNNVVPGGFTVTAQANGGGGVVVPSGGSYVIYCDGTDMFIIGSNNGLPITVPNGGTGVAAFTAYAVICGGTTAAGNLQSVAPIGNAGQVLTSAGAGALPSWQDPGAGFLAYTPFELIAGPNIAGGAIQSLGAVGAAGQTLVSNGAGALPTWQNPGAGLLAFTPYAVVIGPNAPGGGLQTLAALGNAGQVLTSNGAGAAPTWQNNAGINQTLVGLNRLINGDFQVWQRGAGGAATFATTGILQANWIYTADRWQATGGAAAATISQQAGATSGSYVLRAQRNNGSANTDAITICQSLTRDMCIDAAGNVVTISFKAKSGANFSAAGGIISVNVISGTGAADISAKGPVNGPFVGAANEILQNQAINNVLTNYTFSSAALGAGVTQLAVAFSYTPVGAAGAADYFDITDVQLEVSPAQSPYDRKSFNETFILCKRFYWKSFSYNLLPAQNVGALTGELISPQSANGVNQSTFTYLPYFIQMQRAPTVTSFSPLNASSQAYNYSLLVPCTGTAAYLTTTGISFTTNGDVASVVGNTLAIHYTAEADLN